MNWETLETSIDLESQACLDLLDMLITADWTGHHDKINGIFEPIVELFHSQEYRRYLAYRANYETLLQFLSRIYDIHQRKDDVLIIAQLQNAHEMLFPILSERYKTFRTRVCSERPRLRLINKALKYDGYVYDMTCDILMREMAQGVIDVELIRDVFLIGSKAIDHFGFFIRIMLYYLDNPDMFRKLTDCLAKHISFEHKIPILGRLRFGNQRKTAFDILLDKCEALGSAPKISLDGSESTTQDLDDCKLLFCRILPDVLESCPYEGKEALVYRLKRFLNDDPEIQEAYDRMISW